MSWEYKSFVNRQPWEELLQLLNASYNSVGQNLLLFKVWQRLSMLKTRLEYNSRNTTQSLECKLSSNNLFWLLAIHWLIILQQLDWLLGSEQARWMVLHHAVSYMLLISFLAVWAWWKILLTLPWSMMKALYLFNFSQYL